MDKLLEELKSQLSDVISEIKGDNIDKCKKKVDKYFKLAQVMIDMMQEDDDEFEEMPKEKENDIEEVSIPSETQEKVEVEPVKEEKSVEAELFSDPEPQQVASSQKKSTDSEVLSKLANSFENKRVDIGFPLSRNLFGGFLITGNSNDSIFVPESTVRNLGLEDGDIVSAEPIKGGTPTKPHYRYRLIRKGTRLTASVRVEFKYGITCYDSNLNKFYVDSDIYGKNLKIDDVPTRFMISDSDAKNRDLQEGDIVDVAWYENNFTKGSLTWKYLTKELPDATAVTPEKKILNFKGSSKPSVEKPVIKKFLAGKEICLIGADPYHAELKEVVESRGGSLETLTSDKNKTSMSASIRNSDLVVICTTHISHDASTYANARAKHYGVPFTSFTGFGKGKFLNSITEVLKIND